METHMVDMSQKAWTIVIITVAAILIWFGTQHLED